MNTSARHDLDYDYPCNKARPVADASASNYCVPRRTNHYSPGTASSSNYASSHTFQANANINQPRFVSLDTVVPLPNANLNPTNGCYYDVPKNIPVNPLFANQCTSLTIPRFPHNESASNLYDKPKLPQKSSTVLTKISSYTAPIPNYTNANEAPYMNKFGTLGKQNTSKPLPPLPGKTVPVQPVTPGITATCMPEQHFNVTLNAQDDDDEDDCDYDYDYVCLESKKKLDDEDASVKKAISRDLQSKYERLVLNSTGMLDLQNLEKSLQGRNLPNHTKKTQVLQSYRHFLSTSLRNFESWAKFNIEIIERTHPPSVYINFTKHILLSGQNLLLVAKSLNRHFGNIESLSTFSDSFYDYLRQIVVKTRKAANAHSSTRSTGEMVESIRNALQYANNLDIDFAKHTQVL